MGGLELFISRQLPNWFSSSSNKPLKVTVVYFLQIFTQPTVYIHNEGSGALHCTGSSRRAFLTTRPRGYGNRAIDGFLLVILMRLLFNVFMNFLEFHRFQIPSFSNNPSKVPVFL